jgi:hypothetical protein
MLESDRIEDFGSETHLLNDALEKCFGQKGCKGWTVWIKGGHLIDVCRSLRDEYERLAKLPKEAVNLPLLDIWMERLLDELERM